MNCLKVTVRKTAVNDFGNIDCNELDQNRIPVASFDVICYLWILTPRS
jgi:hypothetical protein